MANSRPPGPQTPPLGFCQVPARSPGTLGVFDQGDPLRLALLGDTPGPLGWGDLGAPLLPSLQQIESTRAPGTPARAPDGKPVTTGGPPAAPVEGLVTLALLKVAEPTQKDEYLKTLVDGMNRYAKAYQVDKPLRLAHFLAQVSHENHLKIGEESGNYSAARMREIFGCNSGPHGAKGYDAKTDDCKFGRRREKLWTQESTYAHNAQNLLNYVYASRNGNGDEASGDGYKFRGRGMIQLTGRTNYAAFTKSHNARCPQDKQDFCATPDLIVTSHEYGVESAFYFWSMRNINVPADADDVTKVSQLVNGGTIGLDDRKARLARLKTALGISK